LKNLKQIVKSVKKDSITKNQVIELVFPGLKLEDQEILFYTVLYKIVESMGFNATITAIILRRVRKENTNFLHILDGKYLVLNSSALNLVSLYSVDFETLPAPVMSLAINLEGLGQILELEND